MAFEGSCHCGTVTFSVAGDPPTTAMSCNCSHCRRKGLLLTFVPASDLTVRHGAKPPATYLFYKHKIEHRFCEACGCQPFAFGKGPDGAEVAAVNLRCVPDVDLDALELQKVDGASF